MSLHCTSEVNRTLGEWMLPVMSLQSLRHKGKGQEMRPRWKRPHAHKTLFYTGKAKKASAPFT